LTHINSKRINYWGPFEDDNVPFVLWTYELIYIANLSRKV